MLFFKASSQVLPYKAALVDRGGSMLTEYASVLIFILVAAAFVVVNLFVSRLLRPRNPYTEKLSSYECGEDPEGEAWIQFNIRFYVVALIFLIFDVEIAFLYPWGVVMRRLGLFAFLEMAVFILILSAGFVYVWKKGDLEWVKASDVTEALERRRVEEQMTQPTSPAEMPLETVR